MNTKPSIKASSLVLLLMMSLAPSLVPSLVIAADEMTDSPKVPNISNSMELPATPAEIPAATQTITPSKSVNTAEMVNSGEAQTNNAAPNPSNCQSDNRATGGSGDAQVNKGQVSSGQVDNDRMKPLAAEFAKLDKTGNGLVIPGEATRGKAFNKKSLPKPIQMALSIKMSTLILKVMTVLNQCLQMPHKTMLLPMRRLLMKVNDLIYHY